jgi:hypothetical protein
LSDKEAQEADFGFWPRLDDDTESDLLIVAGPHYLMFEAKYYSGFGAETDIQKGQLQVLPGLLTFIIFPDSYMCN